MPAESSRSIFVRLPAELREWVVHEALVGRRSMSAVVVEAVDFMKSTQTYQFEDDQHAAAIKRAISVAHLPKGCGRRYSFKGRARPIVRSSRMLMARRWCSPTVL
jgi:hypothetical protein